MIKQVIVDGYPYEVTLIGSGAPTWVFLHGFMGTGADFAQIQPHGTCVYLNLFGFGPDAPVVSDGTLFHMKHQTQSLAALFKALAFPPVNLVGYSMGGRLALGFALAYPELVAQLILEGATAGIADAVDRAARQVADNQKAERIEAHGMEAFVQAWEALPMFASQKLLPKVQQTFMHQQRVNHQAKNVANSLRYMGTGAQPNYWPALAQLAVPVSLLVGQRDLKFQGLATKLLAAIPQAQLKIIDGVGHNIHFEAPIKFTEALNALND
ncbi:2-succinyl-6-hydroxy-2,4-cyclohexadiene-1-carboxylate synthase [Periweissella ghanensis]|uniref:Putative 2-succinyl-6-hydroxy-2,4-cyclohexadiene-1-carboxylate synthase n=1 Tax=Periweissella ghanensis TaxID=467997 RepID=A0ABM8Z8P2_9LACO|nr:2-succinyl-6-hydroxy-2,4-cyclohexadiene-1-carboxylate synthase [Periweissella ghanensis]MCM0601099.1 2-succinyl-6-hydroxy-2,4-cyclohexadiene-1-carboxylate synthase [Periweissella ghanensis]CAH0417818.1 2-succinyl-6-hydroxy-2, 4-cyclohexadiene-1-carboxylate synthase [Periweissella ghanensis]